MSTTADRTNGMGNGAVGEQPEHVRAEHVEIVQGGAASIEATSVSISEGGAARVRAGELSVSQGGVALARTDTVHLAEGASAFAVSAREARLEPGARVFVLLARRLEGDVRPVVDWRTAAAFGVAAGLVVRLLGRR